MRIKCPVHKTEESRDVPHVAIISTEDLSQTDIKTSPAVELSVLVILWWTIQSYNYCRQCYEC